MTKIYKLKLIPKTGLLSELHSDTIWGHFCWRLFEKKTETYGKSAAEYLEEFISFYEKDSPPFTISDGLIEYNGIVYFPKPLLHINASSENQESKLNKTALVERFDTLKTIRKKKYISLNQLNHFIKGEYDKYFKEFENLPDNFPQRIHDLRVGTEIDRLSLRAKKERLFSYHPYYYDKPSDKDTLSYVLLIKVFDEDKFFKEEFDNILVDVFNTGFGKKKSAGYGEFSAQKLKPFVDTNDKSLIEEPQKANGFLVLGNYIPSEEDEIIREKSYYDYFVKYGKLGESLSLSANPFKKPIITIKAGSCFGTGKSRDFYGSIARGIVSLPDGNRYAQCGMPLTLRFRTGD